MSTTNSAIYIDPSTGALSTSAVQFRNRIINGDMRIDQRLAGASVTLSTPGDTYTADRWAAWFNTGGIYSVQRVTNATAPGNVYALQATVTTSVNPTSSNGYYIHQKIEGFHASDFGLGTSSASPFTISFWVRASIAGAYSYILRNDAKNRSYVTTYTINAVNTWEYKIITVPGDVTGTWLTNSSTGLDCIWGLGFGSLASTASSNTWLAGGFLGLTGSVQWISALGATFAITNVQVEKGQIATALEVRPYALELALCQRYYYKLVASDSFSYFGAGSVNGAALAVIYGKHPVTMRGAPTHAFSTLRLTDQTNEPAVTSISTTRSTVDTIAINVSATGGALTTGRGCLLGANNSTSAFFDSNAEL